MQTGWDAQRPVTLQLQGALKGFAAMQTGWSALLQSWCTCFWPPCCSTWLLPTA